MAPARLIVLTLLCAAAALGGTKHVKTTATGSGTGTEASPWTIPQMNAGLVQGDTALIYGGVYHELIYLQNSNSFTSDWFTVKGKPGDSVVVDGKLDNGGLRPYGIMGIGYDPITATYHKQRYVRVRGIHFRNQFANSLADQENAMFIVVSGPGNDQVAGFDFELAADHVDIRGCTFVDPRDQTNTSYFSHDCKNITGVLVQNGHDVTVAENVFIGCRFAVFHTNFIDLPQRLMIADNVILNTRQNGINLQQPFLRADSVSLAEIGIVRNIIHRVYMEDGIQLEHNVGQEGYPLMRGLYIVENDIRWPGENCIDLKGWLGPELVVSGNILVGSMGDDNGLWTTFAYPYPVHDKLSLGTFSFGNDVSTHRGIIRFNCGWGNANFLTAHQGFRCYNNTILANNGSWEGDATLNGVGYDYEPAWNEPPKVIAAFFKKRAGCFQNNIVISHNGANVSIYQTYTEDTLHINWNLYRDSADNAGARMRNKGPWPNYVLTYYNTKAAWQAFIGNASAYPNFTGDDVHSKWENPGFATAPLVLSAQDSATFELASNSKAIGAAGPLAMVTWQTDQGTTLRVDNAYSFWGGSSALGMGPDSIIWNGPSGWSGGARPITAISGDVITVGGGDMYCDVGDSVWLWRRGVRVDDIGAIQYGEGAQDTTPPPPPPPDTTAADTVTVSWKDVLHPIEITGKTHLKMANIQRVSIELVLHNPSLYTVTWDDTVHWLTAAPPPKPSATTWYTILRGDGFKVYGAMTAPVTGEQGPTYFEGVLGSPLSNAALATILNAKADSSRLARYDSATIQLLSEGTSWLAPANADSTSPPVYFPRPFYVDSILIWFTSGSSDLMRFDPRFGLNASLGGGGTSLKDDGVWVDNATSWFRSAPTVSLIPAHHSAWVYMRNKAGSPKRASLVLKGRWLGSGQAPPPPPPSLPVTFSVASANVRTGDTVDVQVTVPEGLSDAIAVAGAGIRFTYGGGFSSVQNVTDAVTLTGTTTTNVTHFNGIYYQTGITAGTKTFRLTATGSYYKTLWVAIYYNAAQADPVRASAAAYGTGTDVSVNVSSDASDLVVDNAWYNNGAWSPGITAGAGQTERVDYHEGEDPVGHTGMSEETGASTTTMSWTIGAAGFEWTTVAVSIKRAN